MKTTLLLLLTTICGVTVNAQNKTADKQAIEKQVDAFIKGWNNHNFADFKTYATDDAEWVNVVGMYWKNLKEVQYAHQYFHDRMFKNVPLTKNWITIRFITRDVAIAHVNTKAGAYTTPGGINVPESDNMATMTFIKKYGDWFITACENVTIDERAKHGDPVLHMEK